MGNVQPARATEDVSAVDTDLYGLCPRMKPAVELFEVFLIDMCVNLCGAYVGVT